MLTSCCRFDPVDALVYTLIFDTTPVAFGALGTPVTTLASLTGLPIMSLSAMMGRQLPLVSVFLPAYALLFYAGPRAGLIECWPAALVAGVSFALFQAVFANWVGPELPDLIAGLFSLISLITFVQFWKPPYRIEYEANLDFLLLNDESAVTKEKKDTSSKISSDLLKNNEGSTEHKEHALPSEIRDTTLESSVTQHGEDTESQRSYKSSKPPVEKLSRKETFLAWSPWVIIVLVVIM
jgi:lactate permease